MTEWYILYITLGMAFLFFWKYTEKYNQNFSWFAIIIITAMVALRHPSMGIDLGYNLSSGYLDSFDFFAKSSWKQVFQNINYLNYEPGYILFNKLVSIVWENQQFFLAVCAIISIIPIGYIISQRSESPLMSFLIYLAFPIFFVSFSGLRQAIAIGICYSTFNYIQNKKIKKFIIVVLLASFFHSTALLFLLAYPIYHIRLNKKSRLYSVLAIPIMFFIQRPLFRLVLRVLSKNDYYIDNNGSYVLLLFFVVVFLFCSVVSGDDAECNGYLNLFYVCCLLQTFGFISSVATRTAYYFMVVLVLLLPKAINCIEPKMRVFAKYAFDLFFIIYGLDAISDSSWAMTAPYYWFWEAKNFLG